MPYGFDSVTLSSWGDFTRAPQFSVLGAFNLNEEFHSLNYLIYICQYHTLLPDRSLSSSRLF